MTTLYQNITEIKILTNLTTLQIMSTALTTLDTKEQKATVKVKTGTIRRIKTPVAEGMTVL